jgi:RimJ/RimL family protein N-acetyltransferase
MELKALGFKSEFIFTGFDGLVEDRGHYMVIRTPTNPTYFWGNLLIFDKPPKLDDYEKWVELFKKEFTDPRIYHITLAWDSGTGIVPQAERFIENGYKLETTGVMSATSVIKPVKFSESLEVRPLRSKSEWDDMIQVQIDSSHDYMPKAEWESFYRKQAIRYQKMVDAGMGHWFGGFIDGKLVSSLGLFHNNGLGRFQIVSTHPDHTRKGYCSTLVYKSAQYAFDKMGVKDLVMCADPDYFAINIYESCGFQRRHIEQGVSWYDKNHQA